MSKKGEFGIESATHRQGTRVNFSSAIRAIVSSRQPGFRAGYGAVAQLNQLVKLIIRKASLLMVETLHTSGRATILPDSAMKAVLLIAGPELSDKCMGKITSVLDLMDSIKNTDGSKRSSIAARLGLFIPPSLVKKHLRIANPEEKRISDDVRISSATAAVIAAFLDEVVGLCVSAAFASVDGEATFNARNLLLGASSNPDLYNFIRRNSIYILGAGVAPFDSPLLVPDEKREQQNKQRRDKTKRVKRKLSKSALDLDDSGEQKGEIRGEPVAKGLAAGHKRRPIKVTSLRIQKLQAAREPLLQRLPFKQLVKQLLNSHSGDDYQVNPNAIASLQNYVESRLVDILREAIRYTVTIGGRMSLDPALLVEIAASKGLLQRIGLNGEVVVPPLAIRGSVGRGERNGGEEDEPIPYIKDASVRKLAHQAGWARLLSGEATADNPNPKGPTFTHAAGAIIEAIVAEIVEVARRDMEINKQKKLSDRYLRDAGFSLGILLPVYQRKRKMTRRGTESDSRREWSPVVGCRVVLDVDHQGWPDRPTEYKSSGYAQHI